MESNISIAPCPFCGESGTIFEGCYSNDGREDKPWKVMCNKCGASVSKMPEYGDGNVWWKNPDLGAKHMREAVVDAWNHRTGMDSVEASKPCKVLVDYGDGLFNDCECDGVLGVLLDRGAGVTGLEVDIIHHNVNHIEALRVLSTLNAYIYKLYVQSVVDQSNGGADGIEEPCIECLQSGGGIDA